MSVTFGAINGDGPEPRKCEAIIAFSPTDSLDFAAIKLARDAGSQNRNPLKPLRATADYKWKAFILQHPGGRNLRVSNVCRVRPPEDVPWRDLQSRWEKVFNACLAKVKPPFRNIVPTPEAKLIRSWFYSECHTLPGSSGAPIVNETGQVAGLHYAGEPYYDQSLALYGGELNAEFKNCLDGSMSLAELKVYNKGLPICPILEEIARQTGRKNLLCE
jgi:hypothetical protein